MKNIFYIIISLFLLSCSDDVKTYLPEPDKEDSGSTKLPDADEVVDTLEPDPSQTEEFITDEVREVLSYESKFVRVKGTSSLILTGSVDNVLVNSTVNLLGGDAWIFFKNVDIDKASQLTDNIKINSQDFKEGENADIIMYYNGFYIKPKVSNYIPLYIYKDNDETMYPVALDNVYTGSKIPVGDNAVSKIILKRGHMLVMAEHSDGTGNSKVFIATEKNQEIELDDYLKNKVSFMRTVPWSYVTKKGIGGTFPLRKEVGMTWHYRWGIQEEDASTFDHDYVPMFWGNVTEDGLNKVFKMTLTNHVLAFNEPDGAEQANKTPEKAIELYPPILKLGLRVGSPACKEGQWKDEKWLDTFMKYCKEKNYRVDFIAIHWYDWGNWASTPEPNDAQIDQMVTRLENHINSCYEKYGLPIWITEFNANTNRKTEAQIKFLQKALPMLEKNPYVERYAYFQPSSGSGDFLDANGNLTKVAEAYAATISTPAYK